MGLYRARLVDEEGRKRKFRLLLFAALPDRVHGEVISPVGTTVLILDGGGGRVAVTLVRDRVAYVGPAGARAVERIVGVPLDLEQLVGGLLRGEIPDGAHRLVRDPPTGAGLPQALEIEAEGRSLMLQLKTLKPLRAPASELGTGNPPPGMRQLPLDELGPVELPGLAPEEGEAQ